MSREDNTSRPTGAVTAVVFPKTDGCARRVTLISLGRLIDLDRRTNFGAKAATGACHSFQPEVEKCSHRIIGSSRDYTDRPGDLLANLGPFSQDIWPLE